MVRMQEETGAPAIIFDASSEGEKRDTLRSEPKINAEVA